ncbi:GNAT family N-acetyltransferase [Minwuia sp.]|uniref:GNAT family N-acetyltransferase n=1 Tax=Minwuia sp. TaxID=2493630 RepID=UPI003A91BB5B
MDQAAVIRDARPSDLTQITGIYGHWVRSGTSSFELEAPDLAEMTGRFEAIVSGGYPYLVLAQDERVLGYAYAGAYRPRPAYRFTAEDSIYMAPDSGGQGHGRRLLTELLARLRAQDFRSVIGVVGDPDTNRASVALHRAAGFTEFGRARQIGFKFDRWLDVAYLQLKL